MEDPTNTPNSAQVTGQKPPTKVFILQVGHTRFYNIHVEAESKEQAEQAWEEYQFEYSAKHQPDYEWEANEFIKSSRFRRLTFVGPVDGPHSKPLGDPNDHDGHSGVLTAPQSGLPGQRAPLLSPELQRCL
jgi:hypothetical protein